MIEASSHSEEPKPVIDVAEANDVTPPTEVSALTLGQEVTIFTATDAPTLGEKFVEANYRQGTKFDHPTASFSTVNGERRPRKIFATRGEIPHLSRRLSSPSQAEDTSGNVA